MVIITDNSSARQEYIIQFMMADLLGYTVRFNEPCQPGEALLAYTVERPSAQCLHIRPYGLLTESGVVTQQVIMDNWEELPSFFSQEGEIPFDIFSAAFYLVSRYEEYLPHEKDMYGRFAHKSSLAFREGFLSLPLVDLWAMKLRELVRKQFPMEVPVFRHFSFTPSYDIDHAWQYLNKGMGRTIAQIGKDLIAGNMERIRQRIRVLRKKEKDPYEIYEWLDALHLRYRLKPYYFFPLAANVRSYDRNISPYRKPLRELLAYHAAGYKTGIHPSWQSGDSDRVFQEELALFAAIAGAEPLYSRFHYIRFNLPEGYRKLIRAGIIEDHSMGYGTVNGFRASTSYPFAWYDLNEERVTSLHVHPYCWMDANSYYEQGYTPAQAYDELRNYHDVIKRVHGHMEIISHNNFLSTERGFAGWKEVYEIFLDQVVYWEI